MKKFIAYIDKKIDLKKFFKFGITGVLNTVVDFAAFSFCLEILKSTAIIAQVISQCAAIINSYFINKNWTFQKRKNYNINEMLKFLLVNGISIGLNVLGMYLFHNVFGFNEYLCKIPISFITVAINYFGNKLFVFK